MNQQLTYLKYYPYLLLTFSALALTIFGMNRDIWSANEGQRAYPPLEMMLTENWIVPHLNGELYLKKPPLLYWILIIFYSTFGTAEWVARIPGILSFIGIILVTYHMAKDIFKDSAECSPITPILAGLVVCSNLVVIDRARNIELDIHLCLFVTLSYWMIWKLVFEITCSRKKKIIRALLLCTFLSMAHLIKFPVPLLFIGSLLLGLLVSIRSIRPIANYFIWICLGLSFIPLVIWAIFVVDYVGWERLYRTFYNEMKLRVKSTEINTEPFWFYVKVVMGSFFPWCLIWFIFFRRKMSQLILQSNQQNCFLYISPLLMLFLLSLFPAKESDYIISALPLFALGLARIFGILIAEWERSASNNTQHSSTRSTRFYLLPAWFILLGALTFSFYSIDRSRAANNTFKHVAVELNMLRTDGNDIAIFQKRNPGLFFYLQRPILRLKTRAEVVEWVENSSTNTFLLISNSDVEKWDSNEMIPYTIHINYLHIKRSGYSIIKLNKSNPTQDSHLPLENSTVSQ
jgi:4-amino-4-deoxy-L-arabinose transferase-like glycosyltransferase